MKHSITLLILVSALSLFIGCGKEPTNVEETSDLSSNESSTDETSSDDTTSFNSSFADNRDIESSEDDTDRSTLSSESVPKDDESSDEPDSSDEEPGDDESSQGSVDPVRSSSSKKYIRPGETSSNVFEQVQCPTHTGSYPYTPSPDNGPVYAIFVDGDLPDNSKMANITLNDNGLQNRNPTFTDKKNRALGRWATPDSLDCEELTEGNNGWAFNVQRVLLEDSTAANSFFMIHNQGWTTSNLSTVSDMKFDIKTSQDFEIRVESENLDGEIFSGSYVLSGYSDNAWHSVTIPVTEFGSEMQWEFTKIYFLANSLEEDSPLFMDNLRFTGYEENNSPILKGTRDITVAKPLGSTTIELDYIDSENDAPTWTSITKPSFGSVSISESNGTLSFTYKNKIDASQDAFEIEITDGQKNFRRYTFNVAIEGGTVNPMGIYTDDADALQLISETAFWNGGGSEQPSDQEGAADDMLWDLGAGGGGIYFTFPAPYVDIKEMATLSFELNFHDTTETTWGLENVRFVVSIEDSKATPEMNWSRYSVELEPEKDFELGDMWQTVTIDLQPGYSQLSSTDRNGTYITAEKDAIKSVSIALYNGAGQFMIDNVRFNPKE
ncbi:MAG: hypothetical protein OCC49_04425 [Fibrobacterales bacterium]